MLPMPFAKHADLRSMCELDGVGIAGKECCPTIVNSGKVTGSGGSDDVVHGRQQSF